MYSLVSEVLGCKLEQGVLARRSVDRVSAVLLRHHQVRVHVLGVWRFAGHDHVLVVNGAPRLVQLRSGLLMVIVAAVLRLIVRVRVLSIVHARRGQ